MERQHRIDLLQHLSEHLAQRIGQLIIRADRIHMHHCLDPHLLFDLLFDIIDHIMALKDITPVIDFHMHADKEPVWPIVMHDEVMDAQHPVIFADAGDDLLDDIRIRRLAQQLIEPRCG